jgi:TIR domain-containing protein
VAEIFISYRREDAGGYAGRLEDGLERAFGAGSAFRDVMDLRPGEDYFQALNQRIAGAVAVLVVIGPRWLVVERDGQRRLEQEDDVVRQEVQVALASGKPVIPVLVGGATMPEAVMLPAAVAGLARFQAVSLSDAGWDSDLARLTGVLAPLLAQPRAPGRRHGLAAALAALLILGGAGGWWWSQHRPDPTGTWRAEVVYDWGDRHREQFVFERFAGQWRGTASYLGYPRPMANLRVEGAAIHFETRTSVMMGSETRELTHRYAGELEGDSLRLVLTTEGGFSPYRPVRFTARRDAPSR